MLLPHPIGCPSPPFPAAIPTSTSTATTQSPTTARAVTSTQTSMKNCPPTIRPSLAWASPPQAHWDNYTINYPTAPFSRSFYADTGMFSAEVRIAFPFGLPNPNQGFYCLPRIGVGALVNNFQVGQPYYTYPNYYFGTEINHTGIAVEVRPDIEIGYRIKKFNIGVETSYMAAWGNFGKLGNIAQEFRLGLVVGYRF